MLNYTTHNGGAIKVDGIPVRIENRAALADGSGIDHSCPACLKADPKELVDFVQFGMLVDQHDMLFWCDGCARYFVLEFEVKA